MNRCSGRIDILMCTFRRPEVRETLASLNGLEVPDGIAVRIVVSDNDDTPSAQQQVKDAARNMRFPVVYCHAPARNISIARNAGLDAATTAGAHWVAFLDDDETVDTDWLAQLVQCANESGADAVFGPSVAEYGDDAPEWMRQQDFHSNRPERRDGVVQTGHTCNAFLRWGDAPWVGDRFDEARGRAGGEDTEFFFRLYHAGARFEICDSAIVREAVTPGRLSLRWIMRRKFRSGQSYASIARGGSEQVALGLTAAAKAVVCAGGAVACVLSTERRNFWLLRGVLHIGVIAGCLSLRQPEIYGGSSS